MLEQRQAETAALVFRFDGDVQQMRFIEDDLHHPVAHLLLTFEHQPDLVLAQPVEKDPAGPGVAVCRVFDFQHGVEVGLGHRAEG